MPASDHISWAALLAKWTEFAKASVALPDTGDGGRWKKSVPHIISLQSIAMALGELDSIGNDERPLALDRAEITCRESAGAINDIWQGEEIPEGIVELVDDARIAFEDAANAGVEWTVSAESHRFDQPQALVAKLRQAGFAGDLFVPSPGAQLFKNSPAAFARDPGGADPHATVVQEIGRFLVNGVKNALEGPTRVTPPHQVYRQMDFAKGGPVRDVVVPMDADPPPGRPMLVPAMLAGQPQPLPPASHEPPMDSLPVEFLEEPGA